MGTLIMQTALMEEAPTSVMQYHMCDESAAEMASWRCHLHGRRCVQMWMPWVWHTHADAMQMTLGCAMMALAHTYAERYR